MTKEQQFYLREYKLHPNYENFTACRAAGLDTMKLLTIVPEKKRNQLLKTAERLGLEDLDFRTSKDYSDPSALSFN